MNKEDIATYLTYISGVDVFANSRKRANVEMRSLLTFILRNQFDMNQIIKTMTTLQQYIVIRALKPIGGIIQK